MTATHELPAYRYRVMTPYDPPVTFNSPDAAAAHLDARGYDLYTQPSPGIVVYTCGELCAAILRIRWVMSESTFQRPSPPLVRRDHECDETCQKPE